MDRIREILDVDNETTEKAVIDNTMTDNTILTFLSGALIGTILGMILMASLTLLIAIL